MKINTPEFLSADFFMKNESQEYTLPMISPHQIHGADILHITDENFADYALPKRPEADGILLTTTLTSASLRFADCAPVMIYGKFWVMILHSGYKGTVLNISAHGLELIKKLYGDDAVKDSHAWIGPCIVQENYCRDTSDEWTQKGMHSFHEENFAKRASFDDGAEKIYFDLAGEIHTQLLECGLSDENITLSGIDTFTDSKCCSYRRGDIKERMMLYVKLIDNEINARL